MTRNLETTSPTEIEHCDISAYSQDIQISKKISLCTKETDYVIHNLLFY